MIYFKSCIRCSGDVVLADDAFGAYTNCLACGHVTYPQTETEADRSLNRRAWAEDPASRPRVYEQAGAAI
jgi:hypothetical protein